jgi:hypothetical protein
MMPRLRSSFMTSDVGGAAGLVDELRSKHIGAGSSSIILMPPALASSTNRSACSWQ